jgi:hypothetical protein
MASITIKDLPDNVELDRKAMRDIVGGARYRTPGGGTAAPSPRATPIVDFRTGPRVKPAGRQSK